MFGSFSEEALSRYEELVLADYKEKKIKQATQGTEIHDNLGIGPNDTSFIDNDESTDADDYSEWDFTICVRGDGSQYGIADGKQCRKGTKMSKSAEKRQRKEAEARKNTPEVKKKEAIRKRGETSVKKATAEKVLSDLKAEGKRDKATKSKAEERRREKDPYTNRDRAGQITSLIGRGARTIDRLRERQKRAIKGGAMAQKLEARINRLQGAISKLQKERQRLTKKNAPKGEGFGRIPAAYETGRSLG